MGRRFSHIISMVLVFGLLLALPAAAEDAKSSPRVQKFVEVERGFWLRATGGAAMTLRDVFADGREASMMPGQVFSLELGYDFGQVASVHFTVLGQQVIGVRELSWPNSTPAFWCREEPAWNMRPSSGISSSDWRSTADLIWPILASASG